MENYINWFKKKLFLVQEVVEESRSHILNDIWPEIF